MTDAERWTILRALLGYVEDGSHDTVTISQDDATKTWAVRVGKYTYCADSLDQALTNARAGYRF